jgi:predicted DNA-binding protein
MLFIKKYPKNMSIYLKFETYDELLKVAQKEGRKPGNLVRRILEKWVEDELKNSM